MRWLSSIVLVSCLAQASTAAAAILASYPFSAANHNDATATLAASASSEDSDANSLASNFTAASGLVGTSGAGIYSGFSTQGSDSIYARISGVEGNAADSIAGDDYFSFSVAPDSGFALDLTSLTFQTAITRGASATAFSGTIFVRSSVDSYAADLFTLTANAATSISFANRSIDLSDAAFQGLASPVEFRFYVYDSLTSTSDAASVLRLDTVALNGNTVAAIPEPSLLLAGGLSLCGILLFRRRRAA